MAKNNEKRELYKIGGKVIDQVDMPEFIENNFLPYSWSVCLDRALAFSQDGLKPIQRRILYTAYINHLSPTSRTMKSATFCGQVMRFSPHAESYSSVVNLAKAKTEKPTTPTALRIPLIAGKGNWGGIDLSAQPAASSRYTEMSLWPAAMELVEELNENAVEMVPNFNGTELEPKFLPAKWPVAIINGVPNAMAVGFACNMPCHNPNEVMDSVIALLDDENAKLKIKGPDFNCGCDIISTINGVNGVKEYLETGAGTFQMQATYEMKEEKGRYILNFYHLPFKVSPEKVIDAIAKQYEDGKLRELQSWKDLSDVNNPVNLELITRKAINLKKLLEELYASTPLRQSFSVNNTIIINNKPSRVGIKTLLLEFIEFRKQCTRNKLNYRLADRKKKLDMQKALASVLLDIDECIRIIRESKNEETAHKNLKKTFNLNDEQAKFILGIQLRRLTKTDQIEVKKKVNALSKEVKEIEHTLNSKKAFIDFIRNELQATKEVISDKRQCKIYKNRELAKEDERTIYLQFKDDKVKRSFEKGEESLDGNLYVITPDGLTIHSVYELSDNKWTNIKKLEKKALCLVKPGDLVFIRNNGKGKLSRINSYDKNQKFQCTEAVIIDDPSKWAVGKLSLSDMRELSLSATGRNVNGELIRQ